MEEAKLKPKQLKCIEAIIAYPNHTNVQLADEVGVNRNTITAWKRNEQFRSALKERIQEVWKDSEMIAVKTMRDLAEAGSFNAAKYILDSMDYAPAQRIEADINTDIIIDITE